MTSVDLSLPDIEGKDLGAARTVHELFLRFRGMISPGTLLGVQIAFDDLDDKERAAWVHIGLIMAAQTARKLEGYYNAVWEETMKGVRDMVNSKGEGAQDDAS